MLTNEFSYRNPKRFFFFKITNDAINLQRMIFPIIIVCANRYFAHCLICIKKRVSSLNLHSNAATIIFSIFCEFNKSINAYIIFLHYFVKITLVFISNGVFMRCVLSEHSTIIRMYERQIDIPP